VDAIDKNVSKSLGCFVHTTKKPLLRNVSGIFKAGQVTAIMGSSGAGKTTLLNVLAKRVSMKNQEGTLKANDLEYSYENFGDFANYVMQHDILIETLTVRETLMFAANLKLKVSEREKEEAITELVRQLKLENCLDVLVGGYMLKGISGGEKKRTSIAF
jgi:ABC-type multidrug transport system ATPase subunit